MPLFAMVRSAILPASLQHELTTQNQPTSLAIFFQMYSGIFFRAIPKDVFVSAWMDWAQQPWLAASPEGQL